MVKRLDFEARRKGRISVLKNKKLTTVGWMLLTVLFALLYGGPDGGQALAVTFQKGDIFAGVGTGRIKHFDSSGTFIETLDTTTNSAENLGMCFDSAGNLYTTDSFGGVSTMSKFDKDGNLIAANFGSGFNANPESCVVDAAQNIYVGQPDGTGDVLKFNSSGTLLDSFNPAIESRGTDWIDLAADQCTVFYTSEGMTVKRFNVCTDTQLPDFATELARPCYALRIRPNGEVMVACNALVYRLNSNGSVVQTYPIFNETLFALNLDPGGNHFWTAGYTSGNVYKVEIATGNGTGAPLFNAQQLGCCLSGLAIFGEITASQPTVQRTPVPTLTEWGMVILALLLGCASVYYYVKRQRPRVQM